MRKTILSVIILFLAPQVLACGGTVQHFASYWTQAKTIEEKNHKLENLPCGGNSNYLPASHDPLIAGVLVDAIKAGVKRELIERVLQVYECAYLTRTDPSYQTIREFIGEYNFAGFCQTGKKSATRSLNATSGVNIREWASTSAPKAGAIPAYGYLNVVDESDPEWARIESRWGNGYVHKSLLGEAYYEQVRKIAGKPRFAHPLSVAVEK